MRALRQVSDEIDSLECRKRTLERDVLDTEQLYLQVNDEEVRKLREILLISKRRELADTNLELEKRMAKKKGLEREQNMQLFVFLAILGIVAVCSLFQHFMQ